MSVKPCCLDPRIQDLLKLRDTMRLELHLLAEEAREDWRRLELSLIDLERRLALSGPALDEGSLSCMNDLTRQFAALRAAVAA